MFRLPTTATAPFCPSEVQGSVVVAPKASIAGRLLKFAGPGLLVAVGYMDPGNWATDIEAGSRYGNRLLSVVLLSSLMGVVLQCFSVRLGLASRRDLAQLCRAHFSRGSNLALWGLAEVGIVACDLAEVLGGALAFHLLLHCSMLAGIALTALDTLIVLSLKGRGFRQLEAIVLGLVGTIGLCFAVELLLVQPDWGSVFQGFLPGRSTLDGPESWYVAVGILGATVMPHNLYLHSSIVQTRRVGTDASSTRAAIRFATVDAVGALLLALVVNAAILVLASSAFHGAPGAPVADIESAYHLLDPLVGAGFASLLFGIALLASGQSSTFTGTIAGQVILEGSLGLWIPCWQRRLITRGLALGPAVLGVLFLGPHAVAKLLVLSQVVLSLQVPFAIVPLLKFTADPTVMRGHQLGWGLKSLGWGIFTAITGANVWLVKRLLFG